MTRTEVRLAGFGGQGIGRAGYVLGKAIALHDAREAVFTQEYGPASRGEKFAKHSGSDLLGESNESSDRLRESCR